MRPPHDGSPVATLANTHNLTHLKLQHRFIRLIRLGSARVRLVRIRNALVVTALTLAAEPSRTPPPNG